MKVYIKYILQKMIAVFLLPFYIFPIKKNRILFLSLEGGSICEYSCNPKAFCEYVLRHAPNQYELVWLFSHPENYANLKRQGLLIGKHFTLRGFYYALTSGVVITNGGYLTWFPFRKSQLTINTWHGGGAYKKLENDTASANAATRKRMEFSAQNTDAFLSSSKQFTDCVIRHAFLYHGEVLSIGMPRNDVFFSEEKNQMYQKVRNSFALPMNSRILLYVPTFRSNKISSVEKLSAASLLDQLSFLTKENWYLLYRSHAKATAETILNEITDHCINVSAYADTQELLCAADWMISDYSSVIWDYCLLNRPIILFTPDLKSYISRQGFYLDITSWGFPLCESMEEVLALLPKMAFCQPEAPLYHRNLLGSYEKGNACESLLTYIQRKT